MTVVASKDISGVLTIPYISTAFRPPVSTPETIMPLTTSRPRPLNTLSVVATTLPPFRCKSHMTSRRPTWGNMLMMLSTSASRTRLRVVVLVVVRLEDEDGPKKRYRRMRPLMRMIKSSVGRDIVCDMVGGDK